MKNETELELALNEAVTATTAAGLIATEAGAARGNLWSAVSSLPPLLRGEGFIVATPGIFEQLYNLLISQ